MQVITLKIEKPRAIGTHSRCGPALMLATIVGCGLWLAARPALSADAAPKLKLVQQAPNCSDADVTPAGWKTPAFRLVLPEFIFVESPKLKYSGTHMIPGRWEKIADGLRGTYRVGQAFEATVEITGKDKTVDMTMGLRNLTTDPMKNVSMLVCSSVNHLPGNPSWANPLFMPATMPLDRDLQGRYWYQHVTPQGLRALGPKGWVATHPHPDNPDPDGVPQYNFLPSRTADWTAYAAQSLDGKCLLFQSWDRPSGYEIPCPGNACMHLRPLVAERLEPGATATIHGRAGLFEGNWRSLRKMLEAKAGGAKAATEAKP